MIALEECVDQGVVNILRLLPRWLPLYQEALFAILADRPSKQRPSYVELLALWASWRRLKELGLGSATRARCLNSKKEINFCSFTNLI